MVGVENKHAQNSLRARTPVTKLVLRAKYKTRSCGDRYEKAEAAETKKRKMSKEVQTDQDKRVFLQCYIASVFSKNR